MSAKPSQPGARNILLVEDDEQISSALQDVLGDEGHTISAAGNGEVALRLLRAAAHLPDVIVLDVMMPVMDGPTFRRAQLADPRLANVPVIFITAFREAAAMTEKLSASAVLSKPLDLEELLAAIHQASPSASPRS